MPLRRGYIRHSGILAWLLRLVVGRIFGAGLRDLVGRHALRGPELALFVLRDVLERPLAEAARTCGVDARAARRHLASARIRVGLSADADASAIGQWLVTELVAPPTRALQLQLFTRGSPAGSLPPVAGAPAPGRDEPGSLREGSNEQGPEEAEDGRQARLALEEGEPRA